MKSLQSQCLIGPVCVLFGFAAAAATTVSVVQAELTAHDFLQVSGVKGGLIAVIGCDDVEQLVRLRVSDSYLVHGLDTDSETVQKARAEIRTLRSAHASDASRSSLDGKISVSEWDGRGLPYVDNLVNLLVQLDVRRDESSSPVAVARQGCQISMAEIARVLAPRGVALIRDPATGRAAANDRAGEGTQVLERRKCPPELKGWSLYVKRVPSEIADWTHYLHGPDNNALAEDSVVGPPHHMQWCSEPLWGRHHDAEKGSYPTVRNVLSASGRLICLIDQTRSSDLTIPSQWAIVARDAFSGALLWKRSIRVKTYQEHKKKWGLEELWRQLIVDKSHVYVALAPDQPLSAFDIDTGRTIRSYDGTTGFQEVIKAGNTLFLVMSDEKVVAVNAVTGQRLWDWSTGEDGDVIRVTLAAASGRAFLKTDRSVVCLLGETGQRIWRRELAQSEKPIKLYFPREKLIVKDNVVLVSYAGKDPVSLNKDKREFLGLHPRVHEYDGRLAALSAEDGRILWETTYYPNLEGAPGEIYVSSGVVWAGPEFSEPRDLHTGRVLETRPIIDRLWTDGHHHRCYPGKATSRYILTAKRGIEFIDLAGTNHSRNNWVRGTCRVGVVPCNGLIYAPPHSCGCYTEAHLFGFWALAGEESRVESQEARAEDRLERGPAYQATGRLGAQLEGATCQESPTSLRPIKRYSSGSRRSTLDPRLSTDWPTYRHDNARSGGTRGTVADTLNEAWCVALGGRLSALTIAEGTVFVAQIDAHTVHALDARSGSALWQFTTGGRVDSPPTIYEGLVLFGSADGYVYCLRATDGALVWRFLAAPMHRNAVAFDQIESLWPVHGSVLVRDVPANGKASKQGLQQAVAYVAAGRSSYLDGGIALYGLVPATGKVLYHRKLESQSAGATNPPEGASNYASLIGQNVVDYKTFLAADRSDAFTMSGALTDVLVSDDDSVFLRHVRLDTHLRPQPTRRAHLYAVSSLLDDYEHNRSYWLLGSGDLARMPVSFPFMAARHQVSVPYGVMLTFDDETVWSIQRIEKRGTPISYTLSASPRPDPMSGKSAQPDFRNAADWRTKNLPKSTEKAGAWSVPLVFQPRALLRAGTRVFVAGRNNDEGVLQVVSALNGRLIRQQILTASPVWDGLAAASGAVYLSLENGTVMCLTGEPW